MADDKFNGIVLYNIERDGCLNGVYTNEQAYTGRIYNEIARRQNQDKHYKIESEEGKRACCNIDIEGHYDCQYFDVNNEYCRCELEIKRDPITAHNVYRFYWRGKNGRDFEGIGYQMNHNQLAVSYW